MTFGTDVFNNCAEHPLGKQDGIYSPRQIDDFYVRNDVGPWLRIVVV